MCELGNVEMRKQKGRLTLYTMLETLADRAYSLITRFIVCHSQSVAHS
jgi:hypothetical protein